MSGPFRSFDTSLTGLNAMSFWLDTIAHNIANANTVNPAGQEPFRESVPLVTEQSGTPGGVGNGVAVAGLVANGSPPVQTFEPDNPLADANGVVTKPVVDIGTQMVDMIQANRSYQANLRVVEAAHERYKSSLEIGK